MLMQDGKDSLITGFDPKEACQWTRRQRIILKLNYAELPFSLYRRQLVLFQQKEYYNNITTIDVKG